MENILLEWFHLDVGGQTCERCSDTGDEIKAIVSKLANECRSKGVKVELKETLLAPDKIDRSNLITINGEPIENVLSGTQASTSSCESCADLTGQKAQCRTLVHFGQVHETVPQQLIREAICKRAGCC